MRFILFISIFTEHSHYNMNSKKIFFYRNAQLYFVKSSIAPLYQALHLTHHQN